jgi:regulatory protein
MPKVTAIEPQRHAGRVSIFLDGEFALGMHEEVAAALGLQTGQELDPEDLQAMVRAETRRRAKESALRLLGFRARSREELRRRLDRKGYESVVIDEVLEELSHSKLLDDSEFTRAWVEARTTGRPMGRQRIAWELRQKGVDPETIGEALAERASPDAELGLALTVGRQTVERVRGLERQAARRKLAAALQRRGFSWSVTSVVLERLLPDGQEEEPTEEEGSHIQTSESTDARRYS